MSTDPAREATPMKKYASTIKKGRLPRSSSRSVKNRSTERTPVYPLTRSRNPATAAKRAASSLGRTRSPCLEDLLERREVFRVSLEVLPDRGELPIEPRGDTGLQVFRMEFSVGVRLRQGLEGFVDDVAPELRITRDHQPPLAGEQDESRHLEDRISLRLLRGAEGLADLPLDFGRAIVQQNARIRPRFRHLARDEVHPSAAVEPGIPSCQDSSSRPNAFASRYSTPSGTPTARNPSLKYSAQSRRFSRLPPSLSLMYACQSAR